MAVEVIVPRQGWSIEEGTFSQWLKQDGEFVNEGDALFEVESDKATVEVECFDSGILRILPEAPQEGEDVTVGQLLGYIVEEGEPAPWETAGASDQQPNLSGMALVENPPRRATGGPPDVPNNEPAARAVPLKTAAENPRSKPLISPRAARVAAELGVDCARVQGTGRRGRIREQDVRAAASAQETSDNGAPSVSAGMTTVRRKIAQRMVAGVTQAAPVTLSAKVDATGLLETRKQLQNRTRHQRPPSITAMFVKLACFALSRNPQLNSLWQDDEIKLQTELNISVAVDAPAGLVAPVIRDAAGLSLTEVDQTLRDLAEAARAGKLEPQQMQDGTFTISNLGMFTVDEFTPILNLPQCAILGIGRIVRQPAVVDDRVVPRDMVSLSLTFDHRIVDGATAARFLDTLRQCLESPMTLLL